MPTFPAPSRHTMGSSPRSERLARSRGLPPSAALLTYRGADKNGATNRVRPSSLLNTAGDANDHAYDPCWRCRTGCMPRRRGCAFAAPVAFSSQQVPGALGPGQPAAAAELPEVQVRLGGPAPSTSARTLTARLGYDRARVLLEQYAGLDLHQLRHTAAIHLGEAQVPLQLVMAKT